MENSDLGHLSFGKYVQAQRKKRGWTVKKLIDQLDKQGYRFLTAPYISRIEQGNEIPSPGFILKIAALFGDNPRQLLERAKREKLNQMTNALEDRYNYNRAVITLKDKVEQGKRRYGS